MCSAPKPMIVCLGDANTGKTDLLNELQPDLPEQTVARRYAGHQTTIAWRSFLDISALDQTGRVGQSVLRQLALSRADAFLLVFALDDAFSFANIETYLAEVKSHAQPDAPVFLVGLRADRPHAVGRLQIDTLAGSYGLAYAECSVHAGQLMCLRNLLCGVQASHSSSSTLPSWLELASGRWPPRPPKPPPRLRTNWSPTLVPLPGPVSNELPPWGGFVPEDHPAGATPTSSKPANVRDGSPPWAGSSTLTAVPVTSVPVLNAPPDSPLLQISAPTSPTDTARPAAVASQTIGQKQRKARAGCQVQ
jgi:hypothetical protein